MLQCILYQRAVVPALVGQILACPETPQERRFAQNYSKVLLFSFFLFEHLMDIILALSSIFLKVLIKLVQNGCL